MTLAPRRIIPVLWLAALVALALAVACGGGDDSTTATQHGSLTDPQNVPTATNWQTLPEVILLDPNNLATLPPTQPSGGGNTSATATPAAGEPGVCGSTYTVVSGDTTFGIADKCGVDPDGIIAANPDIDPRNLSVGQVLNMPATASSTPTPTP